MEQQNINFSDGTSSLWRDTVHLPAFSPLKENKITNTLIVGAGITGITAAYMLAKSGVSVMLIDADRISGGTSGNTTAKITAQHGLIYDRLIHSIGEEKAALYYQANKEALHWIGKHVNDQDLQCNYEIQPAVVYATTEQEEKQVEKEKEAYERLGILGSITHSIDLPIEIKNALIMPGQAQFHPLMYLHELLADLVKMNVSIFEKTLATDVQDQKSESFVITQQGFRIRCQHVLICSHFPFYDNRFYFSRMFPERSYLIACKTAGDPPEGMYISAGTPKRSIRGLRLNHKNYLLIGGENHKTGRGESIDAHYQHLADFAYTHFGLHKAAAHWSAQDFTTLDQVPYIGRLAKNNPRVLVAAGFHKWGMTTGTLAAQLMTDLVLERANPYAELFSPSRFEAAPMLASFLVENMKTAGQLIKGKLSKPEPLDGHLQRDCGIVASLHGRKVGAYRDKDGNLTVVDATCPHMGCEVNWNQDERTWDCPCHGSRFKANGEVLDGPAKKSLSLLFSESDHQSKTQNT
ncbi:FAD-dependent oxidoreductase [Sporolactobacillus shoreicorticis]|uniref:FAD-dependent oxidoreductase n=1 Tax=Sporolactobacillus shoreicorticis TaxID=1923877 RepID=A0ABW5S2Y6_9BACL|nr:FAD-dependent oxidoreductase [Sporolactobacillus shoreicorticis]MCO7125824.1 FAD-dependent oxidoreductase [Sporolactobacillus shoreicorticis]